MRADWARRRLREALGPEQRGRGGEHQHEEPEAGEPDGEVAVLGGVADAAADLVVHRR